MSEQFYSDVTKLFQLMDLDADTYCDRHELQFSLTECYDAVHGHKQRQEIDSDPLLIEQNVTKQVNFLLNATQESHQVSLSEFKQCYSDLLANAYEEEVLSIDLHRAISALQRSTDRQTRSAVLQSARQYYESHGQQVASVLQKLSELAKTQLPPKRHREAAALIEEQSDGQISQAAFLTLLKELLAVGITHSAVQTALQ